MLDAAEGVSYLLNGEAVITVNIGTLMSSVTLSVLLGAGLDSEAGAGLVGGGV